MNFEQLLENAMDDLNASTKRVKHTELEEMAKEKFPEFEIKEINESSVTLHNGKATIELDVDGKVTYLDSTTEAGE